MSCTCPDLVLFQFILMQINQTVSYELLWFPVILLIASFFKLIVELIVINETAHTDRQQIFDQFVN
jgi:hypothetical protein